MFPNVFFNEETTTTGLTRLAGYRREYDEKNGIFRDKPKHDINSNGSDAFRYLAVSYKNKVAPKSNLRTVTRSM